VAFRVQAAASSSTAFAATAGFTWVSDQNTRLVGTNYCATTYDNGIEILMVMTDPPLHKSGLEQDIEWPGQLLDSGTGITSFDPGPAREVIGDALSYYLTTRVDLWRMRRWLHSLSGRRGSWWQPTFGRDITLAAPHIPPLLTLPINAIDYVASYGADPDSAADHLYLVWADDGTIEVRYIDGAAAGGAGQEVLTIDSALHATATDAALSVACVLAHSRLAADRVEISHPLLGHCEVVLPVTTCPALSA
jgi:hypothetical protein